ncbi:RiPP maturation radical SAM C-methyltransferase [Streptomyces sp. NPDC041068]|uniref:RiPP maturation radical SAM C-methyltransferase n=1 Tax=Streptomyces sp. NPDC041068 TaxID=3155130 RepID=UPI0033C45E02
MPKERSARPVVLVSMPFMDFRRPSLQLGLLKAIGVASGFPVRTFHANLDFAARIGADRYRALSEHRRGMVGDWLFSLQAFGDEAPDPDGRLLDDFAAELTYLAGDERRGTLRDQLLRMRHDDVPAYLDALLDAFPWHTVRVVGFTSTFQQNTASFALARRLKERHAGLLTLFGGANFDGEMGVEFVRAVDSVDAAIIGEGDMAFPQFLRTLAAGGDLDTVPGLARRIEGRVVAVPPLPPLRRLDELPVPDYDEYFQHAEDLGILRRASHRSVWIPVETARGCWWGAKHHCTFCGLNATTMEFRSKAAERVLAEFAQQARRYRTFRFETVDNILDTRYLKSLFPALIGSDASYEIFYEVKANLGREQLKLMADAGVTQIQPGLESLSSRVLRLMHKGCSAAQNINLLRWAQYYGINVAWNLLWGFPGETQEDYAAQAAVMPHLWHLQPPSSANRIWMERFSPLYRDRYTLLGHCRPEPSYRYVYPAGVDLDRTAYFFEHEVKGALPDSDYLDVRKAVDDWITASRGNHHRPVLQYWQAPHFVQIYDGRNEGKEGTYTFEGPLADLYLACSNRAITAATARNRLGLDQSVEAIEGTLRELAKLGLVFLDGPAALALAIPAPRRRPVLEH